MNVDAGQILILSIAELINYKYNSL